MLYPNRFPENVPSKSTDLALTVLKADVTRKRTHEQLHFSSQQRRDLTKQHAA